MSRRYINNFCFCSSIDEFLQTSKDEWLSVMKENYPFVTPYELSKSQTEAWKDEYDVLKKQLNKALSRNADYGKPAILFEYVLWDFDNDNGVRPDVILLSRERIGILEFKTRSITDENYRYVTAQAKKYRHRLLHNHDASRGMKLSVVAVMTSMKDYYEINDRVKCISPDRFEDCLESLMGRYPKAHEDLYGWINSDYHFEKKIDEQGQME